MRHVATVVINLVMIGLLATTAVLADSAELLTPAMGGGDPSLKHSRQEAHSFRAGTAPTLSRASWTSTFGGTGLSSEVATDRL